MAARQPTTVIEGMDDIIRRDLNKHKFLLEQTKLELGAYREARSHEIKRKRHYRSLLGGGKYDDEALQRSMNDIATNIRHLGDKAKLAEEKIAHHTLIVDTLTKQLRDQNDALSALAQCRKD